MKVDVRLLLLLGLGGAIGTVARYLLNVFIQTRSGAAFPLGILTINILGSTLLGFLMRISLETTGLTPELRLFLTAGFCGGFTTFSTFSYDALAMFENGAYRSAVAYITGSVLLSILGTLAGASLAHHLGVMLRARVGST